LLVHVWVHDKDKQEGGRVTGSRKRTGRKPKGKGLVEIEGSLSKSEGGGFRGGKAEGGGREAHVSGMFTERGSHGSIRHRGGQKGKKGRRIWSNVTAGG